MPSNVVPLRRVESVRMSFLRMGAAGQSLQAALATWFDLLHKRSPEDREACILDMREIVNDRSVVFARSGSTVWDEAILVGNDLTRTHEAIAAETLRVVSLATPIAFTHEWGLDQSVNSLVLPFGHPHQVVVVLFDW
ncbi:hypothetical protein GCM10017083_29910 [Thalassobaculum fulvum]|uniref:Uncharacterized protein n=2 Tax=Thalassobaculum fulvum TaxID=1633335 RepID=A0A918XTC8_9PROT|nr:hypothetical protein GCM10017083_29910 [Thalassobaculum fulvum]